MARPTLFTHRKFARLAADIGSEAAALGHLEFIWAAAGQSGDDLLGDARDVELAARWRGEPGFLLAALMTAGGAAGAGFIEERGGLYYVHDLFDHAPKFVAKRAEREAARVASGRTISEIRSEAGKLGGRPRKNQTEPNENQMDDGSFPEESKTKAKVSTPSPALARARALAPTEGTLFESSAPPPSASAAPPGDPVEVWIPFEGAQPPVAAKHGPWRAGTNGAHWEYGVTVSLLANLRSLYPGVEVETQVRQFADWCHRNPDKRKTYGKRCGVLESLHFWLGKRQNGGGTNGGSPLPPFTPAPTRHYAKL